MAQSDEGQRPGYLHLLWPEVGDSGVRLVRIGGAGYESRFPDRPRLATMIATIRGIGAEPLLQVPRRFSAEQASELVRDLSSLPSGKVRFWSIGNEPLLHDRDGIEKVYEYILRIAPALKAADPALKVFVFDECEMRTAAYEALCGGKLDVTGKDANGNWMVDGFTFHRYPNGRDFTREDVVLRSAEGIRQSARALVAMMEKADRKHGRTGDTRLLWGLTEVNVTYANPDRKIDGIGNASFLGGQFMAEMFGIGMELGAFTVAPWCINETDRVATDFGYLGLPPEFHPRSSYYHMQLMARHMTGQFVRSSTNDREVKSIATRSSQGLAVMVLNQALDRDFEYEILSGPKATSSKSLVVTVDAGLPARYAGRLPRQTTVLLLFDAEGRPLVRHTYGLGDNQENRPPHEQVIPPAGDAAAQTSAASAARPDISPLLVGVNVWMNPSDRVWNASRGAGLKIIRIGGGAYDRRMPSNGQLTEWVNRIKAIGAVPMIQVSQFQSADQAADVVRHFNVTTGNRVRYWNIGNEPWLERGRPGDRVALAQTVADYVKAIAAAMRDVDPTIRIFAPDECDYFEDMYNELLGGSADITGKDEKGRYYIDGVSWHRYVGGDLATEGAQDFLRRVQKTRARVDFANQLHGRTGADALQWGIGEFNASGGERVVTYANGQMFGQIYGYVMEYGGTYAITWSMFENGGRGRGTDFSFVNADMTPRPSYYHMQMISQNFSGRYADGRCNVPTLRAYSAVDTDKIAVMLINVGDSQTSNVRLNNDPVDDSCQVNIDAGVAITLVQRIGAHTSMVLVFDRQGQLTKRITYAEDGTPKEELFNP
ncbi:MAG: hypothetical protein JW993_15560 [Sedimentisphaerales bacterium]|nr:hypothetical protein [Sedimentisphaerales bacterium]